MKQEDKLIELWPDYPWLYNVRSPDFKDRYKRQLGLEEMSKKMEQTGMSNAVNTQTLPADY